MDIDMVNGVVFVSTGLFMIIIGLAFYGLIVSGAMLAAAFGLIVQKRENLREIRRFNAMTLELQDANRIWYGNPDAHESGFHGLEKAIEEMELRDTQAEKLEKELAGKEFLEDRD